MSKQQRDAIDAALRAEPFGLDQSTDEHRKSFQAFALRPYPADVAAADVTLGGVGAIELTVAGHAADPTVLYFHGGGYVAGSARTGTHLAAELARRAGGRALSADYRLAPEHPYPAALQDARAAYRGLLDGGVHPRSIAIVGESAGGGFGGRAARVAGRGWVGSAGCHCPDFTVDRPNPQRQDDDVVGRHRRGVHPGEGERSSGRLLRLRRSRGSLDQPDLRRLPRCVADPDPGRITRDPALETRSGWPAASRSTTSPSHST